MINQKHYTTPTINSDGLPVYPNLTPIDGIIDQYIVGPNTETNLNTPFVLPTETAFLDDGPNEYLGEASVYGIYSIPNEIISLLDDGNAQGYVGNNVGVGVEGDAEALGEQSTGVEEVVDTDRIGSFSTQTFSNPDGSSVVLLVDQDGNPVSFQNLADQVYASDEEDTFVVNTDENGRVIQDFTVNLNPKTPKPQNPKIHSKN